MFANNYSGYEKNILKIAMKCAMPSVSIGNNQVILRGRIVGSLMFTTIKRCVMPLTRKQLAEKSNAGWASKDVRGLFNSKSEFETFLLTELGDRKKFPVTRYSPNSSGTPTIVWFSLGGVNQPGLDPGASYIKKVLITYTGKRTDDYASANRACGYTSTPKNCVWHHFHDYDQTTKQGTMYLMKDEDHQTYHWGGVSQYCYANDCTYG